MGTFFSEETEWYKKSQVIYFFEYYEYVLVTHATNKKFILIKCAQCNILLITSCANQGRDDVRCDFGCREIHKKVESNKRVAEYYKTDEGQKKKKVLNSKRNPSNEKDNCFDKEPVPTSTSPSLADFQSFHYIRFILSLFSNQVIKNEELIKLITQAKCELRQHSLDEIIEKLHFTGYG